MANYPNDTREVRGRLVDQYNNKIYYISGSARPISGTCIDYSGGSAYYRDVV